MYFGGDFINIYLYNIYIVTSFLIKFDFLNFQMKDS